MKIYRSILTFFLFPLLAGRSGTMKMDVFGDFMPLAIPEQLYFRPIDDHFSLSILHGKYLNSTRCAWKDDYFFRHFKQDRGYTQVLEHLSQFYGQAILSIIEHMSPELLRNEAVLSTLQRSHEVGKARLDIFNSSLIEFATDWNARSERASRVPDDEDMETAINRDASCEVDLRKEDSGGIELGLKDGRVDRLDAPLEAPSPATHVQLSASSLRYIKQISDLQWLFGKNVSMESVAEIGVGYGGLASFVIPVFNVSKYRFYDLYDSQRLTERYLTQFPLCAECQFTFPRTLNFTLWRRLVTEAPKPKYDLCISNYAFSELGQVPAVFYMFQVLRYCKRGYLIWSRFREEGVITLNEYLPKLADAIARPIQVVRDAPHSESVSTVILVWGADSENTDAFMEALLELPRSLLYPDHYKESYPQIQYHMRLNRQFKPVSSTTTTRERR